MDKQKKERLVECSDCPQKGCANKCMKNPGRRVSRQPDWVKRYLTRWDVMEE
ncbi:hypothetical protein TY_14 [Pseudomonas phage vB_PaeM_Ty]|nr:hypothetical protein TY_14 [Pseudomonas phage vB_PaeM_Ty]